MIDPKLRVLQMVAHHGTVTAAADALHYTPSAVSYQLRQLADQVGADLIVHEGRGIKLTAAARILLRHADVLYTQVERAYAELAATSDDLTGTFTLCGFSTAATRLLPPATAALKERFPHVKTRVIEAEPHRCFDLLLAGDADLALVTSTAQTPPSGDERFDQRPLLDDPLDLVVPQGHPLTRSRRVTLADTADEDWIVGRPHTTYHHLVVSACLTAGFRPNIAHYADEWDTGTALVAYGLGIILVPRLARLQDWPVTRLSLYGDPSPARRVSAATRSGYRNHPIVKAALSTITETADALLPFTAATHTPDQQQE